MKLISAIALPLALLPSILAASDYVNVPDITSGKDSVSKVQSAFLDQGLCDCVSGIDHDWNQDNIAKNVACKLPSLFPLTEPSSP